jgi:predicted RNA-binding protein with PIN domain
VLVDASNVLMSREWQRACSSTDDLGDRAGRLIAAAASWGAATGRVVELVFDGSAMAKVRQRPGIVITAAGREEADVVIDRRAVALRASGHVYWVVSDDRAIRSVAGARAERVWSAAELVADLGVVQGELASRDTQATPGAGSASRRISDVVDDRTSARLEQLRRGLGEPSIED